MKKFVIVCAVCLVIITAILVHRVWSDHRRDQEAAAAATLIEATKPPRFKTEIPPEDASTPDPLQQLVVSVDDGGGLRLNSQDAGTVGDLSRLRGQLEQALKERGDRRSDKTVFVKASSRLKYAEVKKVINAVKDVGAAPVGLQMDDPE